MKCNLIIAYLRTKPEKRRTTPGFTLIELLVVTVIMGTLATIAIPNIITQVGKARESEAKNNLSAIGLAQQAYFFEKATFANDLDKLEVALQEGYYSYPTPTLVGTDTVKHQATSFNPQDTNTRNYSIGVYHNNNNRFSMILCQSLTPSDSAEAPDTDTGSGTGTCTIGTRIK
jgi:type IV pilus assembly protein PilA